MPLSRQAVARIGSRLEGQYVFEPSAGQPLRYNFKRVQNQLRTHSGVADWTLHDIRRTGATLMAEAGVAEGVIERCLSHEVTGLSRVAGVYNRASYQPVMREAFQTWRTCWTGSRGLASPCLRAVA